MFNFKRNYVTEKIIRRVLILSLLPFILTGCQNLRENLTLKNKESVDEFLIEKKNPLSVPPEFEKLPEPTSEKSDEVNKIDKDIDLKKVFDQAKNEDEVTSKENSSSNLEKSISNIIKKKWFWLKEFISKILN